MSKLKIIFLLIICSQAQSASLLDSTYEYVVSFGKSLMPSFNHFIECFNTKNAWSCTLEKVLDRLDKEVKVQRKIWQEDADAEARTSGRSIEEMPSKIGRQVEESLLSIGRAIEVAVARTMSRKKHEGGIDSITISTGTADKKKKKKTKPTKLHLVHPAMIAMQKHDKGRGFPGKIQSWVIGDELRSAPEQPDEGVALENSSAVVNNSRQARNMFNEMMKTGDKMLDDVANYAMNSDDVDDDLMNIRNNMNSIGENRGKKKKKKKAILKLLLLGAVLKAKIGTILQILSFKLQVKFFILALIGLGINLAKLWIEIKNKHKEHPQKIIYYEHAQHQHHYDHEEEHGWGPWSRSMDPPDTEVEVEDLPQSPYAAQERPLQYYRPLLTKD
ncbi:uncharacterized protein LOC131855344 [Achroia grisella]|uniref:uncharacterized protein LOC131855344 n=1 Tax=Achroia grisella TaxID=688607 RepID=UPI0027D27FCE|nr:uncharacterized protein LOC131855344 [Achroia grisella]